MHKKRVFLLCLVLVAIMSPGMLAAQTVFSRSATANATQFLFNNDIDWSSDVTNFAEAGKTLYVGSLWESNTLNFRAAQRLGPLYFSAYARGSIFDSQGNLGSNSDDTSVPYNDEAGVSTQEILGNDNAVLGIDRTSSDRKRKTNSSENTFDVLVGLANGIGVAGTVYQGSSKVYSTYNPPTNPFNSASATWNSLTLTPTAGSFDSLQQVTSGSTVISEISTDYKDGHDGYSYLSPIVRAGLRLPLGQLILRPYAKLGFDFYSDTIDSQITYYEKAIGSGYATYAGISEVDEYRKTVFTYGGTFTSLSAIAGLDVDMGDEVNLGVSYSLYTRIYGNKYTDETGTEKRVSGFAYNLLETKYETDVTVPGDTQVTDTKAYQATTATHTKHGLYPSIVYKTKPVEGLTLAAGLAPSMTLTTKKYQETGKAVQVITYTDPDADPANDGVQTITKTHAGPTTTATIFTADPYLTGALQYVIKPDKLIFNLGAQAAVESFVSAKRTVTQPGLDNLDDTTVDGAGAVTHNANLSSLGGTRNETSYSLADFSKVDLSVTAGFCWTLTSTTTLDILFGSGTTSNKIDASSLTFQLVVRK